MLSEGIKILVTGANGFIGSNLCKLIHSKGLFLKAMALPGTQADNIRSFCTEIVYADITKPETLASALTGITHVFHLAALASDWGPLSLHLKINAEGTRNMLEASEKNKVKRFLHVSSLAVLPMCEHRGTDEEYLPGNRINSYAVSKWKAEDAVKEYSARTGMETVIIRPGYFPYGPGDTTSFIHLANAVKCGQYMHINGGNARISTSYIDNLTEGMLLAAFHPMAKSGTFILCDDMPVSWRKIASDISASTGAQKKIFSIPYKIAFIAALLCEFIWLMMRKKTAPPLTRYRVSVPRRNLIFSNKKAKELLGYHPKISWEEGFNNTMKWYSDYLSRKS